MRKRRLRPTFLLQCITLGFSLGLVAAVFLIVGLGVLSGSVLLAMLCLWFLGIELGLLPALIEHVLTRRAENDTTGAIGSIWFIDEDAARRTEWEKHEDDTSDNPTI